MSSVKKLIFVILLHLVTSRPQINLDRTNFQSTYEDNIVIQHDCLHIPANTNDIDPQQIVSYCMSEWPTKWNIEEYNFNQKFTFDQLAKQGITSKQLYSWSAPMDVIEDYQLYLNQLSTSKQLNPKSNEIFYNCTSPTFGPLCQYSLDGYDSSNLSLQHIIHDYYVSRPSLILNLCYIHLACNLNFGLSCLDWRHICDGEIDCYPDGIDEKDCWQLAINECNDDEYRCKDGQCIPKTLLIENTVAFECIDQSRFEGSTSSYTSIKQEEATIAYEDVRCLTQSWSQVLLQNTCNDGRLKLDVEDRFTRESNSTSDDCWYAFRCCFDIPDTNHPRCSEFLEFEKCQHIINTTCPDMLFIPDIPVHFGHIYFAYTKEDALKAKIGLLPPSYICYNDQLCGGFLPNKTLITFRNSTCRRPEDFPLKFFSIGGKSWLSSYVKDTYTKLHRCNTLPKTMVNICNTSYMYQCVNSSKCIPFNRLDNSLKDCDYGDDENPNISNEVCLNDRSELFFKCPTTNQCVRRRRVRNDNCDCDLDEYGMCDDEDFETHDVLKHISFPTICNGFTELIPINISDRYETDETECHLWHCNNIYTRCDGYWNCPNGEDELDCHTSSSLFLGACSLQYMCLSPDAKQLMCLPQSKVNDGNIDCLGSADEPKLCRLNNDKYNQGIAKCPPDHQQGTCTWSQYLCDDIELCTSESPFKFCIPNQNISLADDTCYLLDEIKLPAIENFLCIRQFQKFKELTQQFFSLDGIEYSIESSNTKSIVSFPGENEKGDCNRGIPVVVWLNRAENLTNLTCLCPPAYFGDRCQYQSQRVSLTVKFFASSDSRQTLFAIVILLIGNDNERTIHSYEQFTYLYIRDCKFKFSIYLPYSHRPKNDTKQYSIHIDIYEKQSLKYRGSVLLPVKFLFLPIQRIAGQINISRADRSIETCSNRRCDHGQCIIYSNALTNTTSFCQCEPGWSGENCDIPYTHTCSSGSLSIGLSADNRSICVCPMHRFGSRCLLDNDICQSNETCSNNGECIPMDEHNAYEKKFFCICPKGFTGDQCEIPKPKIIITFHENVTLPQIVMVHFIEVRKNAIPNNGSTFVTIPIKKKSATIYWSNPYHIAFLKLFKNDYYLITVQTPYNKSALITYRTISPSDRCPHISEVLNETIAEFHLIRRIKYYHLPCEDSSTNLPCFYDDTYFCLCTMFGQQRLANCFEFNSTQTFDCFGESSCLNNGQCLQDRPNCPLISVCMCPKCYYGAQCQFSTNGFGLILDGMLGYHIQPHIKLTDQPGIVQVSVVFTVIITIAGMTDSILSMMTFNSPSLKKVGCGYYLLGSSITTLLFTILFLLKFTILLTAQMHSISNRSFLTIQCTSIDYLLRSALIMDNWLNACVATERAVTAAKGVHFNKVKSKRAAKYVICILFLFIMGSNMYDPFFRKLIDDNDDEENKRIWCIVTYSSAIGTYHSFINSFHFFVPFLINIISSVVIILATTRQQKSLNNSESYKTILREQIRRHKHILISPFILIILAIPRLILAFVSGCMKSSDDAWLFLIGYLVSFIPSMLTFVVFVLPSQTYKKEFRAVTQRYRTQIRARLRANSTR